MSTAAISREEVHEKDVIEVVRPAKTDTWYKDGDRNKYGMDSLDHGLQGLVTRLIPNEPNTSKNPLGDLGSPWNGEIVVLLESAKGKKDWGRRMDHRRLSGEEWKVISCPHKKVLETK